jgi:hypothetical protein
MDLGKVATVVTDHARVITEEALWACRELQTLGQDRPDDVRVTEASAMINSLLAICLHDISDDIESMWTAVADNKPDRVQAHIAFMVGDLKGPVTGLANLIEQLKEDPADTGLLEMLLMGAVGPMIHAFLAIEKEYKALVPQ